MKKNISFILIIALISIVLVGCGFNFLDREADFKVRYFVDGEIYATQNVHLGDVPAMPKDPQMENLIFVGWYENTSNETYDFSKKVYKDIELHAKFVIDAISLSRFINSQAIKSVVTIENKSNNASIGGLLETEALLSQGSGVIVSVSAGYCYVLTNYHVVEIKNNYSKQKLTVRDSWGNEYEATVYQGKSGNTPAISEEYDLALLRFKYSSSDEERQLSAITMAQNDARVGDYVVSIGTPKGLQNIVSYGVLISFGKVNIAGDEDESTSVDFDIINHNAHIDHGSSGGALVDINGQLIGINFAGQEDISRGCAIPISKVKEFLSQYPFIK